MLFNGATLTPKPSLVGSSGFSKKWKDGKQGALYWNQKFSAMAGGDGVDPFDDLDADMWVSGRGFLSITSYESGTCSRDVLVCDVESCQSCRKVRSDGWVASYYSGEVA